MRHPLVAFPVASTGDVDEAESILSRELADLRIKEVRGRNPFHLEMRGVHFGRTMVAYNRFDSDTLIDAGHIEGATLLIMGVGSPAVFTVDGEPIDTTEKGAVLSAGRRVVIHRPAGSGILIMRAEMGAIEGRLREVMGRHPRKLVVFDRSVDLASGVGACARHLMDFLVDDIHRDKVVPESPLLRAGVDDMVLNSLLALPNNYSDELMGGRRISIAPRIVRRAEEFLEANATETVTVSDLIGICNCSRRALFRAFQRSRGYTPMQFLAGARLKVARETLQTPHPDDTVTSIAYACGFSHLGRFSGAYRRRFDETPSETLRRIGQPIDS